MFAEGQELPSPYHRTKFESERIVREQATVPWRVYRPSIVIGHSQTGEMDKIDGPYYFFKLIQKARNALPQWFPLVGPELGWTNIVPVDFVARAMDHIAHEPDLDGQAFHLMAPKSQRSGAVLNTFAHARRQAPDRRAAQGDRLAAHAAARAQERAARGPRRPRAAGGGARARRL